MFLKMQFVKNVLVYVFRVFTFSFCYCFYEGFIHKIILVSQCLHFIVLAVHSKSLDLKLESYVIYVQFPYQTIWAYYHRVKLF